MITLPTANGVQPKGPEKLDIDLGEAGSLTVYLTHPTYADLIQDAEQGPGYVAKRLERSLITWEGVKDETGAPVPFSLEAFKALCEAFPPVLMRTANKTWEMYLGIQRAEGAGGAKGLAGDESTKSEGVNVTPTGPETDRKNSSEPPTIS